MSKLVKVNHKDFGIEETKATELIKGLDQILSERDELKKSYDSIMKMDIEDDQTVKQARSIRLKLKDNRTKGINTWHKVNKDYHLKASQFLDAIKRKETSENERMESNLEEIEKHKELLEKQRIQDLQEERIKLIAPYVEDVQGLDLGNMQDDVFEAYLASKRDAYEAKIKHEAKLEAERIEKEKAVKIHNERKEKLIPYWEFIPSDKKDMDFSKLTEKEFKERFEYSVSEKNKHDLEQERIRKENERLKAEADKRAKEEAQRIEKENKAKEKRQKRQNELLSLGMAFVNGELVYKNISVNLENALSVNDSDYEDILLGAKEKVSAIKEREEKERKEAEEKRLKAEAELKAKKEAEEKAEAERIAQEEAFKSAKDDGKFESIIEETERLKERYVFFSDENKAIHKNVNDLFTKIQNYIKEKKGI